MVFRNTTTNIDIPPTVVKDKEKEKESYLVTWMYSYELIENSEIIFKLEHKREQIDNSDSNRGNTGSLKKICIEKKLLLIKPNGCSFPECEASVETITELTTTETDLRRDSQFSTSSIVGKIGKQLNIQSQEIIDEEMSDVNNGEGKDNQLRDKSIVMVEGSQKRPIEVDTEKTNTMQDISPIKKAKKKVKNENS
ncbi:8508_t:CDS:2 [Diversispora eburnea]|uniref:8508_t:CDS:1 n=1 Tax=Diversispora eburnea TaxID=1213867 RepID=A0A9N9CQV5_9GLOM|nr:8508_t:CDS:2 [Diversispora eburnea]